MDSVSIEAIICLPHNQHRFKYQINNGSFHFVSKWNAFDFFKQYLPDNIYQIRQLRDLLHSLLPFIIIPEIGKIFELKKEDDIDLIRKALDTYTEAEMTVVAQNLEGKVTKGIPNDNFVQHIQDRFMKAKSTDFEKNQSKRV